MMSRWTSATTATQGFKCNHDGAEGWTLQAERVVQRTDGRAGRRVWTTKSWLQGNIHHWACETQLWVSQLCLHPSSQYVIVPPAIEGGLDKLFETMARTQRIRSCFTNVSRQQKKWCFSTLFKWVQQRKWESMQTWRADGWMCSLPYSRHERHHLELLMSFAAMQAVTSRRLTAKAELISRMKLSVQVGETEGRDRDASLRCMYVTLTLCCYRISRNTESDFWHQ